MPIRLIAAGRATMALSRRVPFGLAVALALMLPLGGARAAMGDSDSGSPTAAPVNAGSAEDGEAASYFQQAKVAIKQDRFDAAIAFLRQVLERRPNDADALNLMGFSMPKTGHPDQSLDYYSRALAQNPNHLGANEYLGELYLEMKNIRRAQERLGVLEKACSGSCEEYIELKVKIETFKAAQG
jgi:tetratricopeptide (TPR) repeat protein